MSKTEKPKSRRKLAVAEPPKPKLRATDEAAIPGLTQRQKERVSPPRVQLEDGGRKVGCHPDQADEFFNVALGESMGTRSQEFLCGMLNWIGAAVNSKGPVDQDQLNAALAVLASIAPQNEPEALLAAQMISAHHHAIRCSSMFQRADMLPQFQAYGNLANKFMRTFAMQMEALAKLRRGGEQIVKHVHVHEGGQAVVADTFNHHQQGGGVISQNGEQCQATAAASAVAALPRQDSTGYGVPIPCNAERALQDARRDEPGSAEGQSERLEARP